MNETRPTKSGWIEVVVGPMYSGKTEELIRRLRRAQIARQKVEIFKPSIDTRYGADHIVSHSEHRIPSRLVATATDILAFADEAEVIGIDEGQFLGPELPRVINEAEIKKIFAETEAGVFARDWMQEWALGMPQLHRLRRTHRESEMEKTGTNWRLDFGK